MIATDEQIIEVYRRTRSYDKAGRELGISRQAVERRVLRLRANGVELPQLKKRRRLSAGLGEGAQG